MHGISTHCKSLLATGDSCRLLAPTAVAASRKVSTRMLSASSLRLSAAACRFDICSIENSSGLNLTGTCLSAHMMLKNSRTPTCCCQGSHLLLLKTFGKGAYAMNIKNLCLGKVSLAQHTACRSTAVTSGWAESLGADISSDQVGSAGKCPHCILRQCRLGVLAMLKHKAWHVKQDSSQHLSPTSSR